MGIVITALTSQLFLLSITPPPKVMHTHKHKDVHVARFTPMKCTSLPLYQLSIFYNPRQLQNMVHNFLYVQFFLNTSAKSVHLGCTKTEIPHENQLIQFNTKPRCGWCGVQNRGLTAACLEYRTQTPAEEQDDVH